MLYALRRLSLGIFLIAAASTVLLLSDQSRSRIDRHVPRIAIVQHVDSTLMNDGVSGMLAALASRGYRHGETITIDRFNAQGDMATGIAIASQLTEGGYDVVITSSTPSMQAMAKINRDGRVRHVFGLVADPWIAGVGLDCDQPLVHPAHMVGHGSFPPVDTAFEYARRMLPGLARVGVAWNPAESNSLAFIERGRDAAARMGFTLLEANADTTASVADAVASLITRDAQAIWVPGDNTIAAAIDSVIATGRRLGVPIFTVLPGPPDRGTLFDTGFDFVEVGRHTGLLAADVLEGADLARIPILDVGNIVEPYLSINVTVLDELKDAWRIPDDLLKSATVLVDARGVQRRESTSNAR